MSESESDRNPSPQRLSYIRANRYMYIHGTLFVDPETVFAIRCQIVYEDFKEVNKEKWTGRVYSMCKAGHQTVNPLIVN